MPARWKTVRVFISSTFRDRRCVRCWKTEMADQQRADNHQLEFILDDDAPVIFSTFVVPEMGMEMRATILTTGHESFGFPSPGNYTALATNGLVEIVPLILGREVLESKLALSRLCLN